MNIYKFGGASVKSAGAVQNLLKILSVKKEKIFIVISAMGKTTNDFEILLSNILKNNSFNNDLNRIYNFHKEIINNLFGENNSIDEVFENIFSELKSTIKKIDKQDYDKAYDSIVSFGEIFSTTIISHFLNNNGVKNQWLDARKIIKTDDNFRQASVCFEKSAENISNILKNQNVNIFITQGFIASNSAGETTTLGREGSDYSASVIANLTNAKKLTLWKDVAGIYNADPKLKSDATKLDRISYREATELAYFGAKVIHPKTVKPLMEKNIELSIKSFNNMNEKGTSVGNYEDKIFPVVPIYIVNKNQTLLTLSAKSFMFISEDFFEKVFSIFKKHKIKINLFQNSALNLSLCFKYNENNFAELYNELENNFEIKYNKNLTLITVRHYTNEAINSIIKNKEIIMQQNNRINAFYLVQDSD